jgi:2-isopropylmalate synthase
MAAAAAILAVRAGADTVKTAVDGACVSLEAFCGIIRNCGNHYGFAARIQITEYHRVVRQISRIVAGKGVDRSVSVNIASPAEVGFTLDAQDDQSAVAAAVAKLGYDLSDEDMDAVYNEFIRVAAKKTVGSKELEAIVSGVAMQVPPTYTLVSYMVNSSGGNALAASAQIVLDKKGEQLQGICMGDGPIDAAFVALEQIMGCHFELDDFQIQAVTEGKEAMGSALVKLRAEGKLYAGTGISTDIIGASIRAYLNAVNKIVFEQNV